MNQSTVRCRCGHQVMGREVLRTEPYEKESGREEVYVKYRCRRCKALGEAFIPRDEWDPKIFDEPRNEMNALERDRFIDEKAVSSGDVISFHRALQRVQTPADLSRLDRRAPKRGRDGDKHGDKRDGDKDKTSPDASPRP